MSISLSGRGIAVRDSELQQLRISILQEERLSKLCLYGGFLTDSAVGELVETLKSVKSLTEIDFRRNRLGDLGAFYVGAILRQNNSLRRLNVHNNEITDIGAQHIATALRKNTGLAFLNLFHNRISDTGVRHLGAAIRQHESLRALHLGNNSIGCGGCQLLSGSLSSNTTLLELRLDSNKIGAKGARSIASFLEKNNSLITLNLGGNCLGDEGVLLVSHALRDNESLLNLIVSDNQFSDDGFNSVSKTLGLNSTLVTVNMAGNSITSTSTSQNMIVSLKANVSVTDMKLSGCGFDRSVLAKINAELHANRVKKHFLFAQILSQERSVSWNSAKISVLGSTGCGKSSLIRALMGLPFSESIRPTRGLEIVESCWGQVSKRNSFPNLASFHAAKVTLKEIRKVKKIPSDPEGWLFDSLTDDILLGKFPQRKLNFSCSSPSSDEYPASVEEIRDDVTKLLGEKSKVPYFDEDMLLNAGLDMNAYSAAFWDWGAQASKLVQRFAGGTGINLVVFDVRDCYIDVRESSLSRLLMSMRLYDRNASIILVGTFADVQEFSLNQDSVARTVKKMLKSLGISVVRNDLAQIPFFPVSNKSGKGILPLQQTIQSLILKHAEKNPVPLSWIRFLDVMLKVRESNFFLEMKEVYEIGHKASLSRQDTEKALSLFCHRGIFQRLNGSESLKSLIIMKPSQVVNSLCKALDLDWIDKMKMEELGLENDFEAALSNGILSRDFLEYVWSNDHVLFRIDVLRSSLLLVDWAFSNSTERYYLIPSLLQDAWADETPGYKCVFDFSKLYLPDGVFTRLCSLLIQCNVDAMKRSGVLLHEPMVFSNAVFVEMGPEWLIQLLKHPNKLELRILDQRFAARSLRMVQAALSKVNFEVLCNRLTYDIYLEQPDNGSMISYVKAKNLCLYPWMMNAQAQTCELIDTMKLL